jgi:hypothetical protein
MDDLKPLFSKAYKEGKVLEVVIEKLRANWENRNVINEALIELNNSREIDLIRSFSVLKNNSSSQVDFFSARNILEEILPSLDSPIEEVMVCVLLLVKEAGHDLAAGMLLPPFVNYCATNISRPKEALGLVEKEPDKYIDLMPQIVIAGSRHDVNFYFEQVVRLSQYENIEFRRRAVYSIGRIEELHKNETLIEKALVRLTEIVNEETDDRLLGAVVDSAFSIWEKSGNYIETVSNLIDRALSSGEDYALHVGANLFGHREKCPDAILHCFIKNLVRVKPENKGSLEYIDFGLASLIKQEDLRCVDLLETLLLNNSKNLTLDVFDSAMRELFINKRIFNKLMTKWFIKGDKVLCEGIAEIAKLAHEHDVNLSVTPEEFDSSQNNHVIFLARKSIGFLFANPVTAASILVSLMPYATGETMQFLINLMFDFLLINYPGKVGEYLRETMLVEKDEVKEALKIVISYFDKYIEDIKSAGNIPELHPSQTQRDTHNRRFSQIMEDAMRNAQKASVLLSLVSTSVMLYGRKSVDYIYSEDGQFNRMEIPLQEHSTEMEFPRITNIDPFGLDYTLRIFRAERLKL